MSVHIAGNALEVAKSAWATTLGGRSEHEGERHALATAVIVRAIAERGSISPEDFAEQLGIDASRAEEIIAGLAQFGLEVDDAGNITGCALTTSESPHVIRLGSRELFAWCALDTLFIPGLVGEPGDIESTCPTSGEAIRLRISPDGSCDFTPSGAVLSVFLPAASRLQTGPASPT